MAEQAAGSVRGETKIAFKGIIETPVLLLKDIGKRNYCRMQDGKVIRVFGNISFAPYFSLGSAVVVIVCRGSETRSAPP